MKPIAHIIANAPQSSVRPWCVTDFGFMAKLVGVGSRRAAHEEET